MSTDTNAISLDPAATTLVHDQAHDEHAANPLLHHHFDDMEQQRECNTLGMWAFLITELMMFGGLFVLYSVMRWSHYGAFVAGSHHMNWFLGTVNTVVLLVSSLTMALAVHAAALRQKKKLIVCLVLTFILGATFLGVKAVEWTHDYHIGMIPGVAWHYYDDHPQEIPELHEANASPASVKLFMTIYFFMTGLHGIHMIIGLAIVGTLIVKAAQGLFTNGNDQPVELSGLYWHLIDIIWVFLFPLLYLIGGLNISSH